MLENILHIPIFSYIIEQQTCFLTLTERGFSKKVAYSFLDDLAAEFHSQYGHKINTATRPYSFIEFDTYIQKAKKNYGDARGRRNLTKHRIAGFTEDHGSEH